MVETVLVLLISKDGGPGGRLTVKRRAVKEGGEETSNLLGVPERREW